MPPIICICMLLAARRKPSHTHTPTDAPRAAPPWRQTTILGSNLVYVSRRTRWRRAFFNVAFLRSQFRSGCACGVCLVCSVGRGGRAQHGRRIILLFLGRCVSTVCVLFEYVIYNIVAHSQTHTYPQRAQTATVVMLTLPLRAATIMQTPIFFCAAWRTSLAADHRVWLHCELRSMNKRMV